MKRLTGVDGRPEHAETDRGADAPAASAASGTTIYTPFAPAEGNAQSRGELQAANAAIAADSWDGRPSREAHFVQLLRTRFPGARSTT